MRPRFLNVDVDLVGRGPLAPLAVALGERVSVLPRERPELLSFELAGVCDTPPDAILGELCALVEGLPAGARALWDRCASRELSLGFESGMREAGEWRVAPTTLARIAALGATLTVTIYPWSTRTAAHPPPTKSSPSAPRRA